MGGCDAAFFLEKGQELMYTGQSDVAMQFFSKGLEKEPENTELLEAKGVALMEMGEVERALKCFKKCVQIAPEESGTVWMYIGQLEEAEQAVKSFTKGLGLLAKELDICQKSAMDPARAELLTSQLCSGYCALAEIYMTDLCMEDASETNCETLLTNAQQLKPDNPQVLQALANLKISQCQQEEARKFILQTLSEIQRLEDSSRELSETIVETPSFEFRICTAKILLELGENERAAKLLQALVVEDEEVIEAWVLLLQSHLDLNELEEAEECISVCKKLFAMIPLEEKAEAVFQQQELRVNLMAQELTQKRKDKNT